MDFKENLKVLKGDFSCSVNHDHRDVDGLLQHTDYLIPQLVPHGMWQRVWEYHR